MDTFFALNGCLHIVAGFSGLFVAPVALFVRKGGIARQRLGWRTVLGVPLTSCWHQCGRNALVPHQTPVYPAHQHRPFVNKAGIKLNQRISGGRFLLRIGRRMNTARANNRQPGVGFLMKVAGDFGGPCP